MIEMTVGFVVGFTAGVIAMGFSAYRIMHPRRAAPPRMIVLPIGRRR